MLEQLNLAKPSYSELQLARAFDVDLARLGERGLLDSPGLVVMTTLFTSRILGSRAAILLWENSQLPVW